MASATRLEPPFSVPHPRFWARRIPCHKCGRPSGDGGWNRQLPRPTDVRCGPRLHKACDRTAGYPEAGPSGGRRSSASEQQQHLLGPASDDAMVADSSSSGGGGGGGTAQQRHEEKRREAEGDAEPPAATAPASERWGVQVRLAD